MINTQNTFGAGLTAVNGLNSISSLCAFYIRNDRSVSLRIRGILDATAPIFTFSINNSSLPFSPDASKVGIAFGSGVGVSGFVNLSGDSSSGSFLIVGTPSSLGSFTFSLTVLYFIIPNDLNDAFLNGVNVSQLSSTNSTSLVLKSASDAIKSYFQARISEPFELNVEALDPISISVISNRFTLLGYTTNISDGIFTATP